MNIPGFTAEAVFGGQVGSYWLQGQTVESRAGIVPAIPFCENCPEILEHCARTGGRPRAVCRACENLNCFTGVERPPQLVNPFGNPGGF